MLSNNFSEKSNNTMTDSETENSDTSIQEIEGNDDDIMKSWKRCTNCKRPTIYHEGRCGKNCNLELLSEDQMKQHEMSVLQKIKDKNTDNKKEQAKSDTGQKSSNAVLDPSLIEGLKNLLANQSKDKNVNNSAQNASNLQNSSQFIPTPPWMNMWNQYPWNQWNGPNQQQWNQRQQIPNQQVNQQQFQPQQQPMYQQQQIQNPTQQFMQPTSVPKFTKNMSLEAWKRKINVWSANHVHINESLRLNMILESLKENNERKELQNWVVYNIEEDVNFDMTANGAIDQFLQKFQKKFEVSNWKKCSGIWKEILNFNAQEGETTRQYMERFNEIEAKMRNMGNCIPDVYLAIHLLDRSKIPEITKQNILSKVDLDDKNKVLRQVKTSFDNLVDQLESESPKVNYWSSNQREYRPQSTSDEDRSRWRNRSEERRSRSSNFKERGRSRSKSYHRSKSRGYDERRQGYDERRQGYRSRSKSRPREVFTCEKFNLEKPDIKNNREQNNVFFTNTENKCVVDSGCPKSVAGKLWINIYKQSLMNMDEFKDFHFKEYDESENFKFGPSQVYTSHKAITLPVRIGLKTTTIIVSQVNANIPLLLGRDYLKKWRCNLDFDRNVLKMEDIGIQLEVNDKEHYILDLIHAQTEVAKMINETFFMEASDKEKFEAINKIHKITAHKQQEQLTRFLKNNKKYDKSIDKIISEVVKNCPTCNKFKKTSDRPKVSMPKANDTNQIVAIDLKEMRDDNCYILYLVCEFSKFTRGQVINNKTPEAVIKAIEENWIQKGPGYPSIGFFSDRGTEFVNALMAEYTRKVGCNQKTTPAFSPWSNGGNERNHATVDRTIAKLREDDPSIKLQDAVDLACFWKNAEVRKTGFSSHQLMYGKGVTIPGVIDGNIAIDSPAQFSEITTILDRHNRAKLYHAQADTDIRIKNMLKTRNKEYNDYKFQTGEKVYVKNKDKEIWEGPITVHNHVRNEVIIEKDNRLNSIPIQRVRPVTPTNEVSEIEIPVKNKTRPKKGEKVEFQLMNDDTIYEGNVSQVGKTTGKDKNRCWIKFSDETVKSFDFIDEIQEWKVINKNPEKDQREDNMKVTYYTEQTDKEIEEKEDEILIIKISKDSVGEMNHIIKDAVLKGEIEKFIWVDNKFDVLLSRKNCDMTMETRKDEAGEDCQLPDSYHHNSDLYKPCIDNHMLSFQ